MKLLMIDMASTSLPYDENLLKGLLDSRSYIYFAIHSKSKININSDNFKIIKVYKLSALLANVTKIIFIF